MNITTMFPHENSQIVRMLYFLETALREFIVEIMQEKHGGKWFKSALPEGHYGEL
jgi:hypothetical protein